MQLVAHEAYRLGSYDGRDLWSPYDSCEVGGENRFVEKIQDTTGIIIVYLLTGPPRRVGV